VNEAEWKRLLRAVAEIQGWFPNGVALIGGIAVYAHAKAAADELAKFAAMSHDADFMILLPDFADLRDIEVLTPNRRRGKQQFSKDGFEFDVYVEGQHDLPVPADEAIAASETKSALRVACLEHLLILKLKAYEDRKGSSKGDKDEDDVVRLLLFGDKWRSELLSRLTDEMLDLLPKVVSGDSAIRLSGGNLHEAKALRAKAQKSLAAIRKAHEENYGATNHAP
jgi:hypothetical protein